MPHGDGNLMLGLAALAAGRITPEQFVTACRAWGEQPGKTLGGILADRCWISPEEQARWEAQLRTEPTGRDSTETGSAGTADPMATTLADDDVTIDRIEDLGATFGGWRPPPLGPFGSRYDGVVFHAQGGIGIVSRAFDAVLRREVAIKEIQKRHLDNPAIRPRFLEEARLTARLDHPNIMPVHDLVDRPDRPFYSMRLLAGKTLKEATADHHRKQGGPTLRTLLEAFLGVCNAIGHAHSRGVVHRDIKGQNVILGKFGEVILLDWGLARQLDREDDPLAETFPDTQPGPETSMAGTSVGHPIGTPGYMSPEQAKGDRDRIGARTDVFGLGALLYAILTGHAPYEGGNWADVVARALAHDLPRPRAVNRKVPAALEAICLKAMEAEPPDRYETAAEVADEVRRWLADEPVRAHAEPLPERVARLGRTHQTAVAAAAVLLVTVTLASSVGAWLLNQEKERVEEQRQAAIVAQSAALHDLQSGLAAIDRILIILRTDLASLNDPKADQIRLDFATIASQYVENVTAWRTAGRSPPWELVEVFREAAKVHMIRYQFDRADVLLREAMRVAGPHARQTDSELDRLAEIAIDRSELLRFQGRYAEADKSAQDALEREKPLRDESPAAYRFLRTEGRAWAERGWAALEMGHPPEARAHFDASLKCFRNSLSQTDVKPFDELLVAIAEIGRGMALGGEGQVDDADQALSSAVDHATTIWKAGPEKIDRINILSYARIELAELRLGRDQHERARELFDPAIEALGSQLPKRPEATTLRVNLATALVGRSELLARTGQATKAAEDARRARAIIDRPTSLERWRPLTYARIILAAAEASLAEGNPNAAGPLLDLAEANIIAGLSQFKDRPRGMTLKTRLAALRLRLKTATNRP